MSLLFETIKVKENSLRNIEYHSTRVNSSRRELFGATDDWDLRTMIELPVLDSSRIYRCKFIYGTEFQSLDFAVYEMKPLKTLRLVTIDHNMYKKKYLDRGLIEQYKAANPETDDIIFVLGELITDCSYANLVFFDGNKWITPATPLLKGTKRQWYIDEQIISEAVIKTADLNKFSKMKIINAMIDMEDSPVIEMSDILMV
jgi:4-amino-4-deoxychorismate lyase